MPLGMGFARVSEHELACRMIEAATMTDREEGCSAEQALNQMDEASKEHIMRAARAAILYFSESITVEVVN